MDRLTSLLVFMTLVITANPSAASEPDSIERGRIALTTRAFTPAVWTMAAYENAWKTWEPPLKTAPADYDAAFRDHYGLHAAPFPNERLPMGLRSAKSLFMPEAITHDCMLCHGGSILGKSYLGLGNASLDLQALFEDLARASGMARNSPIRFSNVRGTTEAAAAAVLLLAQREPDLSVRLTRLDLEPRFDLCEDTPAWWLLKKKKTMYHTGTSHARSVRALMQFMLSPLNSAAVFAREEPAFRDIQAYLLSLEAPKYPLPIDDRLAEQGHKLFAKNCAQCHGTYGAAWTYPNKVVDIDIIGTDRKRLEGISLKAGDYYNKSWFGRENGAGYQATEPTGYQAPPLDGIWATAPYFHNGSVPTLYDVLKSSARPALHAFVQNRNGRLRRREGRLARTRHRPGPGRCPDTVRTAPNLRYHATRSWQPGPYLR